MRKLFVIVICASLFSCAAISNAVKFGHFKHESANKPWSIKVDNNVKRHSDDEKSASLRFELRNGDYWWDGFKNSSRVEISESTSFRAAVGQENWYGFSMMIDKDSSSINIIRNRAYVTQWHPGKISAYSSPMIAHVFTGHWEYYGENFNRKWIDDLRIRIYGSYYPVKDFKKSVWLDFVYNIKWGEDGFVNIWLNGKKIVAYKGVTAQKREKAAFKYGIYCPVGGVTEGKRIITYLDEYRRGKSYEDVDPSKGKNIRIDNGDVMIKHVNAKGNKTPQSVKDFIESIKKKEK
ncbi:MAG: heparin lyase I family protein [Desulfobacterales bacterium]|nr:MAG: heparin lyase I family protein [Desulfobacterales bacterium]